jgi:hypothetical protein
MTRPVYVPAAKLPELTSTVTVAGVVDPEAVAVIQSALVLTVNGTVLFVPMALTITVCVETDVVPPAAPVNVSAVGETLSTAFVVTTSVTGIVVMLPEALIESVVV